MDASKGGIMHATQKKTRNRESGQREVLFTIPEGEVFIRL